MSTIIFASKNSTIFSQTAQQVNTEIISKDSLCKENLLCCFSKDSSAISSTASTTTTTTTTTSIGSSSMLMRKRQPQLQKQQQQQLNNMNEVKDLDLIKLLLININSAQEKISSLKQSKLAKEKKIQDLRELIDIKINQEVEQDIINESYKNRSVYWRRRNRVSRDSSDSTESTSEKDELECDKILEKNEKIIQDLEGLSYLPLLGVRSNDSSHTENKYCSYNIDNASIIPEDNRSIHHHHTHTLTLS